jgi:glycosyltransferase involved in cell wall biosynthesis
MYVMWNKKRLSLVLPTFREKKSIHKCIRDFERLGILDEIIVVDNNAEEGTAEAVARTSARRIYEPRQGYGYAIARGMAAASGDYIVVCEPDGTFIADDIYKLLSYAKDFDFVVGTRTTQSLIWEGAEMGWFLKWGNFLLGKIVEFSFNVTLLTDAGCTYRLIKRRALNKIFKKFTKYQNTYGFEMILLAILKNISMIQIPVNYRKRIGKSCVTGNRWNAICLGVAMGWMLLRYRWWGIRK